MKAAMLHAIATPLVIEEIPTPAPGPGQAPIPPWAQSFERAAARKTALEPCVLATGIEPPPARKAALPRRTPKPVGISRAPGKRASVLECGTTVPLSSCARAPGDTGG